ncbi:hypothetical protein CANCADRAFT_45947 [Tortispora caseinolytica NRRL Y-17796]|uniref:NEDD8-conjugating enzyme UBC12 n=1 Tax=Tortispora caseinolytica NRRL Y-17796 TaxID=767744 RepID=A0A1E4TCP1_9ASCO|nr:hypothetical protein CANCADRAFT_45947 [Tortispora caseinolytica NRRL Y-17796]
MLKLMAMKQKQQADAGAVSGGSKTSAAKLRAQKDITELELPKTIKVNFPDPNNVMEFTVNITPDEGFYKNGTFCFSFVVDERFPHEPPKVKCKNKVYHPNIDLEGNVCLNILREDWKPVLNLNSVIIGVQLLFLEPNPTDPLNKEAAKELMSDKSLFARNAASAMRGGLVHNEYFDRVL